MNNNLNEPNKFNELDNVIKSNLIFTTFVNELNSRLEKVNSSRLLSSLPRTTILTFAKFEENFAICFDYKERKIYYMPKSKIVGQLPKPGEALKFYSNDKFYVDNTAILAEEDKIEDYLNECNLAK